MSKYITSNLYATLRDNGINMPTEEVFYKNMSDPNYRKTLHKGLQDKGFDLDDIREFQVHWHNKFANDPNYKGKDEVTSKPVAQQPKQQSQPTQQSSQRMLSGQRVPKQQHIERVETTRSATPKAVALYTPNTKSQIKTNEDVALESQPKPKIERPKVDNTEQATKLKLSIETQQDEIKAKIEDAERRRMEAVREYNKNNRFLSAFVASAQQDAGVDPFASGAYGEEVTKITEEIQSLRNQLKRMTDAHDKIATALETKKGDGLFDLQNFKNIGRGIADTFTDADFWDMGRGEFNANTQMMGISKKIQEGKELTDDELNVVSAELINQSVDQYIQSIGGLPIGYSVGQVTAEATRFMLEMGINPARGASSAITRQLIKKLGVDGIKNAIAKKLATGAIKAVGNVAEAGALVNTMQSMRTAGDAAKRYAGTIDIDNDGNLTVVDNQGMGEALYKAEASAIIENVTELMGGGKLAELTNKGFNAAVKRLGDVISLGKISDFAGKMSATGFGRFVDGMAKRGAWQGFADEVFEEEYGIMLNSLLVGDSSFSDLVDPKQQAEIILGCAFMDGSIKAIKIGGGAIEYRNISKKYRKAESKAKSLFTPEQWEMISSNLGGATDAEMGAMLATYLDPNTGLSPEQRQAVAEYAGSMVRYRGFNRMADNVKEESEQQSIATTPTLAYEVDSDVSLIDDNGDTINGHITGVDEDGNYIVETNTLVNGMRVQPMSADQLDAMGNTNGGEIVDGVQTSTAEGYDITDFDQIGELSMLVDNSRDDVAQALGTADVDAVLQQALGNNPTDTDIDAQFGDNAQVVKEYVHNRAKLNGTRQRNDDDLDIAIESIDSDIANIANTNGNVVTAKLVSEDGDVYVVDGNIVTYEDGQIDVANSDASVIIQKADGSREMVTPLQLQDIASTPTEQYRDELVQAFTDNHRQAYNDAVNGALDYSQGQQYTMLNADGSTTDVTILADNGDGNVIVTARDGNKEGGVTDGKQIVLPKSQIQQGVREFKRNQLRQAKAQQVEQTDQPQQVTDTSEATPEQTPSATQNIAPRDEQGNVAYEDMDADSAWDRLVAESGDDIDIATMVAQSNIEDAQKALDKAKKQTPKLVGTTEEKLATAKAFKESVVKAQNDLAKWQEIADVPKRRASLQTEQAEQTESQGQQVTGKLPASEEVGPTETTPVEEVAQIEESAPIEEQTKGNGSTMSQETDQVEEENRLAEQAERKRIEEERLAKEEAERIAKEAEAKRLAEEQAKEEERKRIEEENRLAEEKAKKERDEFAETVIDNIKKAFDHLVDESKNEIESRNIEDEISQLSDDTIAQTIEEIENTPELSDVLIQIKELVLNGKITGTAKEEQELADGVEKIAQGSVSKNYILPKLKAEQEKRNSENAVAPESEQVGYSITPATYVTKANKVLDMHLLVFDRPLGKEEHKSAREIAKSLRGWYDAKEGGYMMRSEEDAKSLANAMLDKEVVESTQPVSLSDVNDFIAEEPKKESKPTEAKPSNPSGNKLVTDERYAELRERMRKKLGGQMNMGIDPEILAIGTEMAVYHIEKGARKFKDYATDMIADLGDAIRPYLKAFYNGARELPEVEDAGFVNDMTPYEEVKSFDVANFDKVVPNPLDTADAIAKEAEVEKQAEEANEKIKDARNDKRVEFINNLHSGDRVILKDGRNVLISIVMHRGEQVLVNNAFGYTKPTAERFYATYKGELIDFTPDKIDVDATLKFREDLTSKTSESTEKSVPLQDNKLHREFVKAVTTDMLSALDTNERPYRSIVDIRKRAKEVGIEVDNEGRDDILLQELVEDGLVRAARLVNISWGGAKYSRRSFDEICQLYAMQPTIAQRSSNRIKMQQYSTPLPMAWVANHFAVHGKKDGKVLEPTAGNGMLVFSIPPKQVHVNELDETRLANLREQGFAEVTQQDATEPFEGGKQYDVILANPPFGKRDAVEFDGDKISGLDPQITLNALDAMKDNGRAAIIIGGNFEYRPNGAIKDKPAFWSHLYNHYNVVGVVDMSGDMYARQGTTFPTRMILINGRRSEEDRKQGTCYPPVQADAVRKAETFDDLYEIVNELIEFNLNNKTNGTIISSEGLSSKPVSDKPQGKIGRMGHQGKPDKGDSSIEQVQRGLDSGTENPLVAVLGNDNANGEQSRPDKREDDRSGNQGDDVRMELEGGNAIEGSGVRTRTDSADGGRYGGIGRQRLVDSVNDNIGTSSVRSTDVLVERKLDTEKLPYRPHNTAFSLESVAPAHMVEAMDAVLSDIESQYGNIDQFVTDELGYNSVDEMHNALAAEQVDSVAMAIYQMKQGKAMIIGDQTGVGKGRQMASLIRWAVKQGKTPIFATQKADLFSDIYRDLVDIGSGNLIPFIFNARTGKNKGEMVDANGEVVHRGLPDAKMKEVLKAGVLPEGYDFVVLTYSQVNNGPEHPKAKLLENIAKDNYLFLDESHTAAGESKTGECFQKAVASAKAVTFASATYAKRPDTMPLYALRTSMNEANVGMDELIDIIKRGGVTLQEIMSRELTNAGQMVRRERDMSDVVTDWVIVDDAKTSQVARDNYDRTINAFNAIIKFQEDYVNPTLKGESEKVAREMKSISKTKGTDKVGIDNTPFASHTFNYTKQLMLALKVDAIIDYVDREIKAGRHPVIALENTMESSYKDFNDGEELDDTSFSRGLLKGLDSTLKYTIKNNGDQIPGILYPSQLIGDGEAKYYELQKFIYESTKDIFISPLDAIIDGLHKKGYRVGELTGRSKVVSIEGDKAVVRNRKDTDKKKLQREFNSGLLDVLILNKSAATGISLHASERFSDQRQRTMILVQPLSDINDYMQMIGRIDRTGQVHRGYYINLGLPIPAENRFLMMLSTKLKSLNANTTTSQDSESNEVKAPDLLNKYGGQVIIEYLRDNPDVYVKIGEPLSGVSVDDLETYTANDETASKITGRVALLTIKEQEDFYDDVIRRYNDLINYLNDTGTNDLKINVVPLRAETIAKRVTSKGKDPNGNNPFAQDAYLEKVEMDVIRKPMKSAEVQKTIEKVNDGLSPDAHLSKIADIVTAETSAKVDKEVERHNKATERVNAEIESHTKKVNKMDKLSEEEKQKVIEDYANTKIADIADKHSANLSKLRDAQKVYFDNLKLFTTGDTYLIPDNLETLTYSTLSPAIFCGYKTKDSKITASTTFAVFAVLDGRRKIEIKLSEMSKLKNIYYATMQNIGTAKSTDLSNWDSQMPNETRREGYILTGNILQAVADTMDENGNYTGQLVSYTDIDGNVRDGVLMPDNWNPKLLKSGKAPLISKLTQIKNGERVESSDGDVVIAKNRWGYTYTLSVPKTKKRGGKFFEDAELLNLVSNGVFYPNRGRLQADVISERIDRVVQRLTELDVKVEAEKSEDDVMYRTSEEIEAEYPNWLEGTTTDSGKHSTQVEGTRKTYNKVGTWIENNLGKDVSILDASSGMGYGTLDLRERGFNIEDVEPYQSEERKQSNPATYSSYDTIGKEYDYIISNAVLNVIPDDWRANVLHDMAKHLKAGGKMFINTRKAGEEKHIKDKIELDSPQEVLVKRNGKIASYQRFFTPSELKAWVESELRDGYSVEVANEKNSGTKGLAAVVVTKNSDNLRQGEGAYTDAEVSFANDLASRAWGENLRSKKQQQSFANRIRKQMRQHAQSLAETLRVPIEILDNPNGLTGKKARAKGFYDKKTEKATVILSNNNSLEDIEATVLHELVGHYGLRELFGENFDRFLYNVYTHAEADVKERINRLARKNNWDFAKATEEYLASLAEDESIYRSSQDQTKWILKIKRFFLDMLRTLGFNYLGPSLSDNELKYVLWCSYQNLQGELNPIFKTASNVAMQSALKVGQFEEQTPKRALASEGGEFDNEPDVLLRDTEDSVARDMYERKLASTAYQSTEAFQDSMLGLKVFQDAVLEANGKGKEAIADFENAYMAENALSSKNYAQTEEFKNRLFIPLVTEMAKLEPSGEYGGLYDYMMAKHGLERNRELTVRDALRKERASMEEPIRDAYRSAIKDLNDKYKPMVLDLLNQYRQGTIDEDTYLYEKINLADAKKAERKPIDDKFQLDMQDLHNKMTQKEEDYKTKRNKLRDALKTGNINFAEFCRLSDELALQYSGAEEIADYSGLTSLTGEEDVESAEEIAYQMVEDYENSHNTSALWDKINACTADILKKQFEGGLISRDTYNQISAMYENYIPLRGWKETTADDVYTYLTSKSGAFNAPIRTARGRSSVADNPIATIAHMAESGIAQANRNKLKQQFYNFCLNNPSNLASISDVWLQHNPVTDEWEVVSPQIDADATAEEVEQIMSDFNERMKSLAEENPDEYKKGSQAKGIPYKIGKGVLSEHQVLVKVNGKDIIITINGNPRAAQAVNGLTNPDSEMSGAIGNLLKLTNYVNRQLSAFYTTRNPEFVVSNFFRDAIYANSMVWVKESPNYAVKFNSNFGKVNPAKMHQLIRKYRNGSLDMSNEIEKAFYDFMINGGETGYTQMRDLEAHKKELDKALKYSQGKMPVRKAWNMFFDRCDEINRAVENCARFAAFVTSRQMGRTIQRSVYDAKEISVNFNKKGAGDKFANSNKKFGKIASYLSGVGRIFYVFWNAGIQGMANFAKVSKNNPKGAIVACAAMFVSGALVAMLGYDDEERDYYNLPEYVRRSNLCFKVGNSWVTIPLPIEYRAIYGLGELCASVINGGDKYTPKETAEKVAQQFSQLLPLDMLEGGGGWNPLIPTFAKPWAEAYVFNTDWTGLPIYKENTFNELDPEFTKVYKNTNDILVGISEYLNSIDLGRNGNAAKKGDIDINPAKLEYVLEGYFGGLATTFNKMVKMGETTFGDREFEWRNMLIASRLVKEGDERQEAKRVQNQYYNYKQEAEETSNQLSHFRGEKRKGILDNAEELDFLHHSPEYLRYTIFNEYDDDITALNKKIKEMPDGKEKDNLVIELDALRKELVDQLDATRDLTKEDVKQITTTDPNVNYYRAKEEDDDYKEVEIDPLDERFKNATTKEQAEIQKEIDAKMETEGFNHWSNVHDALNAISNTKSAIKSGEAPKNYNDTIHNIKKEIADMRRSYFGNREIKE